MAVPRSTGTASLTSSGLLCLAPKAVRGGQLVPYALNTLVLGWVGVWTVCGGVGAGRNSGSLQHLTLQEMAGVLEGAGTHAQRIRGVPELSGLAQRQS